MNKPTNINELVSYLAEKGHVNVVSETGELLDQRLFLNYNHHSNGLYFFSKDNNGQAYLPFGCDSTWKFFEKSFSVERYGHTKYYQYIG